MANELTIKDIALMSEEEFMDFAEKNGHLDKVIELSEKTVVHEIYPKVYKKRKPLSKKDMKDPKKVAAYEANPNKLTKQKDETATPKKKVVKISIKEVQALYAKEVLGLKEKPAAEQETWRDRLAKRAAAAAAKK